MEIILKSYHVLSVAFFGLNVELSNFLLYVHMLYITYIYVFNKVIYRVCYEFEFLCASIKIRKKTN